MEDLKAMAEDALSGYLGLLIEGNEEIPMPSKVEGDDIIYIQVLPEVAVPIPLQGRTKEAGVNSKPGGRTD
ncbi:MAG: hypothetical protein ACLFQV_12785 [Vulcanimicrobiota bacterium]